MAEILDGEKNFEDMLDTIPVSNGHKFIKF